MSVQNGEFTMTINKNEFINLEDYYVATFHSVSQALRFEKLLLSQGVDRKSVV